MNKRVQPTATDPDAIDSMRSDAAQTGPSGIDRRRHARTSTESPVGKKSRTPGDRRDWNSLRSELQKNPYAGPERRKNSPNYRRPRTGLKPSRIVLLAVAIISGGLAAYMATQRTTPTVAPAIEAVPVVAEIVREARMQVLVANQPIGIGQRLSSASVSWEDWPQGSVRDDYITIETSPEAANDMTDIVARFEIFPGEPIREQKIVRNAEGYLSAVLDTGLRGVSVEITHDSAAGGFISPNDHVDIILTMPTAQGLIADTILHNVRILAIGARLGEAGTTGGIESPEDPSLQMFQGSVIATFELDPAQAEIIVGARASGTLSLVLRSMTDFSQNNKTSQSTANQAIRLTSPFWNPAPGNNRPR